MLTVADIRKTVNNFPKNKPVEELLDELVLLYKVEKGLKEAEEGKGILWEECKEEMNLWLKSK